MTPRGSGGNLFSAAAAVPAMLEPNKYVATCWPVRKDTKQLKEWVWETFISFKSPPSWTVQGQTWNSSLPRLIRPTDRCLITVSHGSVDNSGKGCDDSIKKSSMPGNFDLCTSRMLNYGCMKSNLITDAWSPQECWRGARAANHHYAGEGLRQSD